MEYKPVVTTNTIHIASNIPLVSISVFALFSIGIKDRRDHCGVARIMIFGIASIVAPLRRILEREMTEANRNGFVVGALMSIFITGNETVGEEHV
jgi:xanthine/uracil permease